MDQAEAALENRRSEGYARMSIAKSVAGLFPEVGVCWEVIMAMLWYRWFFE